MKWTLVFSYLSSFTVLATERYSLISVRRNDMKVELALYYENKRNLVIYINFRFKRNMNDPLSYNLALSLKPLPFMYFEFCNRNVYE